ncbi:MAG: ATP-binding cassette domain-containing protein [Bacteroidales bacterium]|nr:ATP-binding cassette domain-containing protein [Bacteroidales bacterium]
MIILKGVQENNLKNCNLNIPKNSFTVITGVSGSGKSSLAFDVLFNEGQRRYIETFSSFSRQYLKKLHRPAFESITGLSPAIAVNQQTTVRNPRSTVGTLSEIYDLLRLLFARFGKSNNPENLSLSLFSFNSPVGACETCKGMGETDAINLNSLISNENLSLREGALSLTTPNGYIIYSQVTMEVLNTVCLAEGFNVDIKWKDLSEYEKNIIFYGTEKVKIPFGKHSLESRMKWTGITAKPREEGFYKGIVPIMEEILKRDRNPNILKFAHTVNCATCNGERLNKQALEVKFNSKNIAEISSFTIEKLDDFFKDFNRNNPEFAGKSIINSILQRTSLLVELGLDYLQLNRNSTSLSGGEAQRIRLVTQACSQLRGLLYVFDEPSIGLHSKDNIKLIKILKEIVANGNTVVVVEHDEETIKNADWIVDIGPAAGKNGGQILFSGKLKDFLAAKNLKNSHTYNFLNGKNLPLKIEKRISENDGVFKIKNASTNNLKNIDVEIKVNALNIVTGVSGAGKSSLISELINQLEKEKSGSFSKIIHINQSPIGRTPRSNPATYTKLFDLIRDLYGKLPQSITNGWDKGRFSFNNTGGRCETCEGAGVISVGMHFLGEVQTICESCEGKRFNNETLEIKYRDNSISDILKMSFEEAAVFFKDEPKILKIVETFNSLGLSYLELGQSALTLSGGEAQRVKLAGELARGEKGQMMYILDEPTTGLHSYDIEILLKSLKELVNKGHTVVVVEHDMRIISDADYIIDLGPGSGENGGNIVACGTVNDIRNCKNSFTGQAILRFERGELQIIETKQISPDTPVVFSGVETHNLKNINVEFPVNKITVVTGVSGSGKSSLVFDTVYSEARNRYLENFPAYVRRYVRKSGNGVFASCSGLMPAVAIGRQTASINPRSTLGTYTELYDLLRLLFSRAGTNSSDLGRLNANAFSFNHQSGACPNCKGLGKVLTLDIEKFVTNPELSVLNGAFKGHKAGKFYGDAHGQYVAAIKAVGNEMNIDFSRPFSSLSQKEIEIIFEGTGNKEYNIKWDYKRNEREGTYSFRGKWEGIRKLFMEEYNRKHADKRAESLEPLMIDYSCPVCNGKRLCKKSLDVLIAGKNIAELSELSLNDLQQFLKNLRNEIFGDSSKQQIVEEISEKIISALQAFSKLGISYLNLSRAVSTLSGGELQRVRIAANINSGLSGIIYILDEPTTGLHKKDVEQLMSLLKEIQKKDNTIILVEHDIDLIKQADYVIDMGPEGGENGGEIIACGTVNQILDNSASITGKAIANRKIHNPVEIIPGKGLNITEAYANNLKNINISINSGEFTVITGVSGSGKSSLLFDVIEASFLSSKPINCKYINGFENFSGLSSIDQKIPELHSKGNLLTYLGLFDRVKDIFSLLPLSKEKKFGKQHFSFNSNAGKCEACKGTGEINYNMDFLADVSVVCEVCNGHKYKPEILEVQYNSKNIAEVLQLTVNEALTFFSAESKLIEELKIFRKAGLDYLKLGQKLNSFSAGEIRRLKLIKGLRESAKGKMLFLIDEPTSGLHINDVDKLIKLFAEVIIKGHTIIAVEHHESIVQFANRKIELGPEGGEKGGYLQ